MKKVALPLMLLFGAVLFWTSCRKSKTEEIDYSKYGLNLPSNAADYATNYAPYWFTTDAGGPLPTSVNGIDNNPSTNLITNDGATLGRILFYDRNLSFNRTIACASCHQQQFAFSDTAVLSTGFEGGKTRRHSMTLVNARYYQRGRFFWDERAATLEDQVLMPFQDAKEMGMTLTQVLDRIKEKEVYPILFKKAFGDDAITSDRVSKALAQFVRSIVSYRSKYDDGRELVNNPGAPFSNFTAEENQGKQLFFQPVSMGGAGCFGCHTTEAFVSANPGPQNNGLDLVTTTDNGAGETFPGQPRFAGAFKTSTLRNIALTAPYMHDGRFATLEQVVEHYNSGVKAHPNLGPALKDANGDPIKLNLTTSQKQALVAFLNTLTDSGLAGTTKWSDPWIR